MSADPIKADCRKEFYPALRRSGSRRLSDIKWIVVHVGEGRTAAGFARWFQDTRAKGSTHLSVDKNQCQRSLPNSAVPWGAHGANFAGFHIEHAGYASYPREKWLSSEEDTLLRGAFKTAYHCHLFKIPVTLLDADDLRKRRKGITTHRVCVEAFGGDHTCPGKNFPMDRYMTFVRMYYRQLGG